jgi:anhydro-N-acetylmuramic acid kinase
MTVAPALMIGLMSGTSLDGIDAALVQVDAAGFPHLRDTLYSPYPDDLRQALLRLHLSQDNELHTAAQVGNILARCYADAVLALLAKSNTTACAVRAIGCHGQTVRHNPAAGYTLQLGNSALLAELTRITVVADFRNRDIAAGGQGAPLVPACHDALFRHPTLHRVILNIGGIANLTDLAPGAPTRGFDCGPGNLLLDAWIQRHLGRSYDAGGEWAGSGHVLPSLLQQLQAHPFFSQAPPKSCGREEFNLAWLDRTLMGCETPSDVQATLAALTAGMAARAVRTWCGKVDEVFICGGGVHNRTLMRLLASELTPAQVMSTDSLGLASDWVEAVAFAWLAHRALNGMPGNLPEVTGAEGRRILGAIYHA